MVGMSDYYEEDIPRRIFQCQSDRSIDRPSMRSAIVVSVVQCHSRDGLLPQRINEIWTEMEDAGDEAHFWLNGYVNKQNCRIWSEANPQVYVETPLHPEKLTVWCALWAGGILLQKR
ncbi:hypothetical protein TNCV_1338981 [Trichonephila clavipes]|nr:hypothetical protein TNCV_1338981 [Trichonephila clavipes]